MDIDDRNRRARPGRYGYSITRGTSMYAPRRAQVSRLGLSGLAPIHSFKRIGTPMYIGSAGAANTSPEVIGATIGTYGALMNLSNASASNTLTTATQQFGGALSFMLAQCATYTELTNLFESYRIKFIDLIFTLSGNQAPSNAQGMNNAAGAPGTPAQNLIAALPIIHITDDPDDATVPSSRDVVLQYNNCQTRRLENQMRLRIIPRAQSVVQTAAANGGTAQVAGGQLPRKQFLDCDSPAIQHFGCKFWIENWPLGYATSVDTQGNNNSVRGPLALQITPVYHLEMKGVV